MDTQRPDRAQQLIAHMRGLRQVRQFRPDPIPADALNDILEVGRWTGSANNVQPWEFVVVQNRDTLRAIADAEGSGSYLPSAACAIVIIMPGERAEMEAYDEGRVSERLMLAADAHGLGAAIWWFKDGGAAAKRILGIPPGRKVRTAIAVGYSAAPAGGHKGGGRKPLAELVHPEHYRAGS